MHRHHSMHMPYGMHIHHGMHRHHNMYRTYGSKCTIPIAAFMLGAAVGIIGSEKIRFFHKMQLAMRKKYGQNCCCDDDYDLSTYNSFVSKEETKAEPVKQEGTESE